MSDCSQRKGVVFDIQRYTIHDGPGIRTEVFLKGCPLRCLWCSNPEGISPNLELGVYPEKCLGIDKCIGISGQPKCIEACLKMFEKKGVTNTKPPLIIEDGIVAKKDRNRCINCLECVKVCPSGALVTFGKVMTVEEVMNELKRDKPFYDSSGGGVTFSGGDPLVQHHFVLELLKESKRCGFHTCLETEAYAKWKIFEKIMPYVDMFLVDIKHMDSDKHKEYTGVGNELILENIKKLATSGIPIIVRTPIVPGYTDSEENIDATAKFISQLGSAVKQYQLLPYFSLMRQKYEALGLEYKLPKYGPSKEDLERLLAIAKSHNIPAVIGAYTELD